MLWSGLRFSDMQRSHLSTWRLDDSSLRGLTWRAKTTHSATPFGIILAGWLSSGSFTWVHKFLLALDSLYQSCPPESVDFAIPSFGDAELPAEPFQAMSYTEALFYLRKYMRIPWSSGLGDLSIQPSHYSIHGLKATLLSWGAQLNLSEADRRMDGKHRPSNASVTLYSRDDIVGSLRLQNAILTHITEGWRPCTPLARGGQCPMIEPKFSLERFRKALGIVSWKFFQFQSTVESVSNLDDKQVDSTAPEEEDASSSSSESSSSSSVAPQADTTAKPHHEGIFSDLRNHSDESLVGCHRNIWHIMMPTDSQNDSVPVWDNLRLKTACGKHLAASKICIQMSLDFKPGHLLCQHVACRKGFSSVGV